MMPPRIKNMYNFDVLMQKRRNSIAYTLELRLFCVKPSICVTFPIID